MHVLKSGVYLQSISYLQHERMRDRRTLYNMTWHDFECCDSYVTERYTPHTLRDPLGNVSDRLSLIVSAPENTKKDLINTTTLYVIQHASIHTIISDLNVFPLGLVVEHMGDVFGEDLLTSSTSVDTHHGHTDGPRSVSYSHLQISIVCLYVHSMLVGFPHKYTNYNLSKYCSK